jgi:iron(II)-dependent oxidoreductase
LVVLLSAPACGGDDGSATTGDDSTAGTEADTDNSETAETSGETGDEGDPNLVALDGGTFEMGCGAGDSACDVDNPAHMVTVSPFSMEVTEVTVAAYTECVDDGGCSEPAAADSCNYGSIPMGNHPINCVSWDQAVDYCAWKGRRLPTEAEWEYAASGGSDRAYPWGSAEATCEFAHMYEVVDMMGDYGCMTGTTAAVGTYPGGASPFGMLDMAGNVDEWVADYYAADYYTMSPATDPQGPDTGTQRVIRGGDWYDASAFNLRVFDRGRQAPENSGPEHGFRCAAD